MWISRASRGRFDNPLSWRDVRGTLGLGAGEELAPAEADGMGWERGAELVCVGGDGEGWPF